MEKIKVLPYSKKFSEIFERKKIFDYLSEIINKEKIQRTI